MKVSVSLPDDDIEFLDGYAATHGIDSRSAVLHKAIRLLRTGGLSDDYAEAWAEWESTGDAGVWSAAAADGLGG